MKTWLLQLIKHKIRVSPIVIRDESGKIVKVTWRARQRGSNLEHHGDDPEEAAYTLISKIEGNVADDTGVA